MNHEVSHVFILTKETKVKLNHEIGACSWVTYTVAQISRMWGNRFSQRVEINLNSSVFVY